MYVQLNSARSYVYAVARACDKGEVSRRVSTTFLPSSPIFISNSTDVANRRTVPALFYTLLKRPSTLRWKLCNALVETVISMVCFVARLYRHDCLTYHYGSEDYPTGRFLRDARLYAVGAGTQEVRRMLIGREFNEEILGKGRPVAQ
jgi:isovaleryl-CoA dehydrogenase